MKEFDPTDDTLDHALTYDEWNNAGFYVQKGQKASGFSPDSKALFTPSQVNPKKGTHVRWPSSPPERREPVGGPSGADTFWQEHTDRAVAKGTPWGVIEDFDSYVREAGMLPDLQPRVFAVNDPLERHFMEVADKHGILDALAFGEEDDYH